MSEDLEVNPVSRMIAALLLCLGLPALAAAETPTWEQHPTKNKPRKHVMVQFTDMSLHPSIAQVVEGGSTAQTGRPMCWRASSRSTAGSARSTRSG
jgi:cytochrome c oxidase assembly factor CtaG